MKLRTVAFLTLLTLTMAACGGSSDTSNSSTASPTSSDGVAADSDSGGGDDGVGSDTSDDVVTAEDIVEDAIESGENLAEDMVDSLEAAQAAEGGGSATLTVGDESWTFEGVLCAFGPEEIGQEGAEFVLSSIQDGKQMYFSIDSFGHSASIDDVVDFENPSVSLSTFGGGDFIEIDGKSFSGTADFIDGTTDLFETVPGSFSGTCP